MMAKNAFLLEGQTEIFSDDENDFSRHGSIYAKLRISVCFVAFFLGQNVKKFPLIFRKF